MRAVFVFLVCCSPLPHANRQVAALLWQRWELPDTLVTARLVSGKFSTLTWGSGGLLMSWSSDWQSRRRLCLPARLAEQSMAWQFPDSRLGHNCNRVPDSLSTWPVWTVWLRKYRNLIINTVSERAQNLEFLNYFFKRDSFWLEDEDLVLQRNLCKPAQSTVTPDIILICVAEYFK